MRKRFIGIFALAFTLFTSPLAKAEDGSRLWLRSEQQQDSSIKDKSRTPGGAIATEELRKSWKGVPITLTISKDKELTTEDGYKIENNGNKITLKSRSGNGLIYGCFHLLRLQECGESLPIQDIVENPTYPLRLLNHWDNLDGTIERGYAGHSLWLWDELPGKISPRYIEYARANASIGINGTVINNVNASPRILSTEYIEKVKTLADTFRPYGIKVFLSVNFASPMSLGGLPTADPLDAEVAEWWKKKCDEIYKSIPDFGGFLVKANSEGQPGPGDYGRSHSQGANMLADAIAPHGGIVMWRSFVYNADDADRAKQAYEEFKPLDGKFRDNIILQVKNGPIDFQPREPYSPLFTAIESTELMAELQVTQEYLGHSNHVAYLATMWEEFFDEIKGVELKGVAGVANIGDATNWCGSDFAQANWYAFGRMAWNPKLTPKEIAEEWVQQTFTHNEKAVNNIVDMMMESREAVVNYMMPLGLHHQFAWGHHYGPEPWCVIQGGRPDWMPSYYHKADTLGLGFDRTSQGSNAVAQYPDKLASQLDNINTCPEKYLLWFHHTTWTHTMKSGRTLWDELCHKYDEGVVTVRQMQNKWTEAMTEVDEERAQGVSKKLDIQLKDAIWWKDACILYFQTFSKMPIPRDIEPTQHKLEQLKKVQLGITNYECPTPELLDSKR